MISDDSDVKKVYTIKEAAKLVGIESHVLRYWEEELEICIGRNNLGHRYYSEEDVLLFNEVKKLKDGGIGLKAIKKMIKEIKEEGNKEKSKENDKEKYREANQECDIELNIEDKIREDKISQRNYEEVAATEAVSVQQTENTVVDFKMAQFQSLLNRAVASAVRQAMPEAIKALVPDIMTESMKSVITENVVKQMDQLMREQDDKEEERFRNIDIKLREISEKTAKKSRRNGRFGRGK